jgi:hypothetical protein
VDSEESFGQDGKIIEVPQLPGKLSPSLIYFLLSYILLNFSLKYRLFNYVFIKKIIKNYYNIITGIFIVLSNRRKRKAKNEALRKLQQGSDHYLSENLSLYTDPKNELKVGLLVLMI